MTYDNIILCTVINQIAWNFQRTRTYYSYKYYSAVAGSGCLQNHIVSAAHTLIVSAAHTSQAAWRKSRSDSRVQQQLDNYINNRPGGLACTTVGGCLAPAEEIDLLF